MSNIVIDDSAQVGVGPIAVDPMTRPSNGPSPFEVPLQAYTLSPWTSRNADHAQWFNYGLSPPTWTQYAKEQMRQFYATSSKAGNNK